MQSAREILIGTSRWLNEGIRSLESRIGEGGDPAASTGELRREADEALARLRSIQGAGGVVGETIPKVMEHVDLFVEVAASAGSAPALSRKLLRHLLEEQLELTARAEREGGSPGGAGDRTREEDAPAVARGTGRTPPPRTVRHGGGPGTGPAPAGASAGPGPAARAALPGGRRALTVGSLIGR